MTILNKATLATVTVSLFLTHQYPQYMLFSSYIWTIVQLFLLQYIAKQIWMILIYPKFLSPLRHLPGPKDGNFFLGQFIRIQRQPDGTPMKEWINTFPNNGIIRYMGLFNVERLLICSPKALGEVLVKKNYEFVKPSRFRRVFSGLLGEGILLAEGEEHKIQRKNLLPAFAFRHIKDLYPLFWSKARELAQAMTVALATAPNSTVEMGGWTSRGTLDIIGVAGLGQDFNSIAEPDSDLNRTYRKLFAPSLTARILTIVDFAIPNVIMRNLPLKRNEDVNEAARIIRKTCLNLIQAKKQMIEKADGRFDVDILSVAIQSGAFTEEGLVNQVMTFMAAGHETTAVAISYAIYLLCLHPEVQTRLREEVRTNLPSVKDDVTAVNSDVFDSKLPYLQAVTNEALRLFILSPLLLREAACDTIIADTMIPKGTSVVIPLWAFNRSKEVWGPDAEEFKPERWLGAGKANAGGMASNYAFSTFGHGPRSCIGFSFAKGEFSCILAAIVGRFEMKMENQKIKMVFGGGILKPEKGWNVKMKVVDGW